MSRSVELCINHFVNFEQLGKGGFGIVYKAIGTIRPYKDRWFAIKEISKKSGFRVEDEINSFKKLNDAKNEKGCSRIVRFYDSFNDDENTYIIMEYCQEGSLRDHILKKLQHVLDYLIAGDVLSQLIEGVTFMHKLKVMHRDLTPGNVLIAKIRDGGFLSVKIADFGLTKKAPSKPMYQTCVGTAGYMAAEIRNREEYNESADVYSLGGILYIMMSARDPPPNLIWNFDGKPQLNDLRFKNVKTEAQDLILQMMSKPEKRIKLGDILHHCFMRSCRTQKLENKGLVNSTTSREFQKSRNSINSGGENTSNFQNGNSSSNDFFKRYKEQRNSLQCVALRPVRASANGRNSNDSAFCSEEKRERLKLQSAGTKKNPIISLPMDCSINRNNRSSSLFCERRQEINSVFNPQFRSNKISRSSSNENRLQSAVCVNTKRQSSLVWPIPYVKHFGGYKRINNYGRFFILSSDDVSKPSIVYEMFEKNIGENAKNSIIKFIFYVFFNCTAFREQRVKVYLPKNVEKLFDADQPFIKTQDSHLYYFRSLEDVLKTDSEVRIGYQQILSFIKMIRNKTTRCKMQNAFGFKNFNMELKYDGTILFNLPNGCNFERSIQGKFSKLDVYENLSESNKALIKCFIQRLLTIHQGILAEETELQLLPMDKYRLLRNKLLNEPFDINITKINLK